MLYEGMDAAAKSEGAMMLTDFSPEVQKQVLKELFDGLKSSQERSAVEHICSLANDAKLDYLPLALRVPVMVPKFFDGSETKDTVLSHAMAVGDDIEVFENREDAYDHRNQLYLKDLPEEARQQVICLMCQNMPFLPSSMVTSAISMLRKQRMCRHLWINILVISSVLVKKAPAFIRTQPLASQQTV